MNPGDAVEVRQVHADGQPYRWWQARVEAVQGSEISLVWPRGTVYEAPTLDRVKIAEYVVRGIFWTDRAYNIVEHYDEDGGPGPIYSDICSPIRMEGRVLDYTDYELDVALFPGRPVHIEDEDEFEEAIVLYGYTPEFQAECRRILEEARQVVETWELRGRPEL